MNLSDITTITKTFKLGKVLAGPTPIHGGKSHALFWFKTPKGEFSIKILSPHATSPEKLEAIRQSERLAKKMLAHGIETSPALLHQQSPFYHHGDDILLVYPWIIGNVLPDDIADIHYGQLIGATLAKIHALKIPHKQIVARDFDHPPDAWEKFGLLKQALPKIMNWRESHLSSKKNLETELVISHHDLLPSNVVWRTPEKPVIIDWELAGPINKAFELMALALNWSKLGDDEACFKAIIQSYKTIAPLPKTNPFDALNGCISSWLDWLFFNLERQNLPEVDLAIHALEKISKNSESYAHWYSNPLML